MLCVLLNLKVKPMFKYSYQISYRRLNSIYFRFSFFLYSHDSRQFGYPINSGSFNTLVNPRIKVYLTTTAFFFGNTIPDNSKSPNLTKAPISHLSPRPMVPTTRWPNPPRPVGLPRVRCWQCFLSGPADSCHFQLSAHPPLSKLGHRHPDPRTRHPIV